MCIALCGCGNGKTVTEYATVSPPLSDTSQKPEPPPPPPIYAPDIGKEMSILLRRLKKIEVPTQHLSATAKQPSIVKGALGSRVLVVPKDMVTPEGQPVTDDIDVELKELPGPEQMALEGVQTVSDGRILISGGSYYKNMTSGGQQLSLKLGKTLKVILPKSTDQQMKLFYGQKDSTGLMNWSETAQQFKNFDVDSSAFLFANTPKPYQSMFICRVGARNDSAWLRLMAQLRKIEELAFLFDENVNQKDTAKTKAQKTLKRYESLSGRIYNEVSVQQFGWINCDRFLESSNLTNIACEFDPADSISYAKVFLVFKSINSIMEERYAYDKGAAFMNVPAGLEGTLVAMAMKKGQLYTSRKDITIRKAQKVILSMKKSRDLGVGGLFKF
jgi:hypothetical protein